MAEKPMSEMSRIEVVKTLKAAGYPPKEAWATARKLEKKAKEFRFLLTVTKPKDQKMAPNDAAKAEKEPVFLMPNARKESATAVARRIMAAGGDWKELVAEFERLAYCDRHGNPYGEQQAKAFIFNVRWEQKAAKGDVTASLPRRAGRKKRRPGPVAAGLLDELLECDSLSDAQKIQALQDMRSGKLRAIVKTGAIASGGTIRVFEENKITGENTEIRLTKAQASLVLKHDKALRKFAG